MINAAWVAALVPLTSQARQMAWDETHCLRSNDSAICLPENQYPGRIPCDVTAILCLRLSRRALPECSLRWRSHLRCPHQPMAAFIPLDHHNSLLPGRVFKSWQDWGSIVQFLFSAWAFLLFCFLPARSLSNTLHDHFLHNTL